ncbi:hypothetical protein FQN54_009330 [Arachnomyces sp. PD_36]|nr:hypothetical protein FQN54_009330 [Arachnomyces sp. PD_36]
MAARKKRLLPFKGSDARYIKYLESLVSISSSCESGQQEAQFLLWKPGEELDERLPQWELQLKQLINDIPDITKWAEQREKYGFNTIEDNHKATSLLLGKTNGIKQTEAETTSPDFSCSRFSTWVTDSYTYARRTADLEKESKLSMTVARFRRIIVTSNCEVMWQMGVEADNVDHIMKEIVSDTGYSNLKAHRRGARWINACIPELSAAGLRDICDCLAYDYEVVNETYDKYYITEEEKHPYDPCLFDASSSNSLLDDAFLRI